MRHSLIALVEDHPGVLNRVVSLFRRRGYNIESLAVGASEVPGLSRMTIVVDVRDVDQVVKQFSRLIEVVTVKQVSDARTVVRETALVKVVTPDGRRDELHAMARLAGARELDASEATMLLEITASPDEVSAFATRVRECGPVELTRSGQIVMTLGAATLADFHWQADGAADDVTS